MLKSKWKVFKKKIDPIHSERDYDNDITSSRDDVVNLNIGSEYIIPGTLQRKNTNKKLNNSSAYFKNFKTTLNRQLTTVSDQGDDEVSVVISKANFYVHGKHVVYCKESLHIFTEDHTIRKACVWFTEWNYAEYLVVFVVIFNAVLLGLIDYREGQENSVNRIMKVINPVFIGLYTLEAIIKIIAMGFVQDEGSYLRSLQNIVDFFVVVSGLVIGYRPLEYFSILRLFRVFLILKDFNFFRMTALMFTTISKSVWQLISVVIMMVYIFGIFAILGLNIYTGVLSRRCRTTSQPAHGVWPVDDQILRVCGGHFQCPASEYCGSDYDYSGQITHPGKDLFFAEFDWGLMNFDNILNSMATIFVMMTMVSWSNIFDMVVDATDKVSSLVFFVATILIILAFTINIVVAIIIDIFSRNNTRNNKEALRLASQVKTESAGDETTPTESRNFSVKGIFRYLRNRYLCSTEVTNISFQSRSDDFKVPDTDYYKNPIALCAFRIISNNITQDLLLILIVFNTVVLALNRFPAPSEEEFDVLSKTRIRT